MNTYYLIFVPIALAIIYSVGVMLWLRKKPSGNQAMQSIAQAIREGSNAYLVRQYKAVGIVALILFIIIYFALGSLSAIGFLVGPRFFMLLNLVGKFAEY